MTEQVLTSEVSPGVDYVSTPATNLRYWARTPLYRVALLPHIPSNDPQEQMRGIPYSLRLKHKYTKTFNEGKPEIRLIQLLPYTTNDRWRSIIRCTLSIVSLESNPAYLALSYTWNELPGESPILIDGSVFNATNNLEAALKHLRHETECICLWVDAICINQAKNSKEKGSQIQLMQRIYREASMVVAWLGVGTQESDEGMIKLDEIAKHCVFRIPQDEEFYAKRLQYINQVLSPTEGSPFPLQQVCSIFRASWWSRIWCLQEVELAREVLVICGTIAMPFKVLSNARDALKDFGRMTTPLHPLAEISKSIRKDLIPAETGLMGAINMYRDPSELFTLKDKLTQTNGMLATDPRDLVWAILSVVRDADELGIKYEDELMCSTLWIRVARALIVQNKDLKLLGWCQAYRQKPEEELPAKEPSSKSFRDRLIRKDTKPPKDTRNPDIVKYDDRGNLPSWVPNLSCKFQFSLSHPGELKDKPLFAASKSIPFSFDTDILVNEQTKTLTISGFKLDIIYTVSPLPPKSDKFPTNFHLKQVLTLIKSRSPDQDSSGWSKESEEAFFRTPICDLELKLESNTNEALFRRAHDSLHPSFKVCSHRTQPPADEHDKESWTRNARLPYERTMLVCFDGRNSFITAKGYVGLAPVGARTGDVICVVGGADAPLVLRTAGNGNWKLVGECFVHGFMDGEFSGVGCVKEIFALV